MKTKDIGLVLFIAVVLAGLMWWGGKNQAGAPTSQDIQSGVGNSSFPLLLVEEKLYNFGTISMANGNVSRVFKVSNTTGKDIKLESVTTSCMCTVAYIMNGDSRKGPFGMPGHYAVPKANELIKSGETRDIEVVYDPAAHGPAGVGPIDRFVYLVDSDGNMLQLEIRALVRP